MKAIRVNVYYYEDDKGKKFIDVESMRDEFEGKLEDLLNKTRSDNDELNRQDEENNG